MNSHLNVRCKISWSTIKIVNLALIMAIIFVGIVNLINKEEQVTGITVIAVRKMMKVVILFLTVQIMFNNHN